MATLSLPTEIQPRIPQGVFKNEPFIDFKAPENARKMKEVSSWSATHSKWKSIPGDRHNDNT